MNIRPVLAFFFAVLLAVPATVPAGTFQWRDDSGVMHYTDNPDRVPARYRSRVKEGHSAVSGAPTGTFTAPAAAPPTAPVASEQASGDRTGNSRRGAKESPGQELKSLEEGLTAKREELARLHHKWAISKGRNPTADELKDFEKKRAAGKVSVADNPYVNRSAFGSPGARREAYYKKLDEIQRDEERISQLKKEIQTLAR